MGVNKADSVAWIVFFCKLVELSDNGIEISSFVIEPVPSQEKEPIICIVDSIFKVADTQNRFSE